MSDFIKALENEATALKAELSRDPRYVKLQEVRRLLALYTGQHSAAAPASLAVAQGDARPAPAPRPVSSGVSLDAVNATRDMLKSRNTPMLTREILDHLEGLGIKFGGSSAQATLASILSRTPEFESKGGRVGWVLKSVEATGGYKGDTTPPVADFPPSGPVEPEAGGGT